MAQKKTSIYSSTQIDVLKRELAGVVDYLQALDLQKVVDVVDWKVTAKGVMPTIISTQEKIIITAVGVIKQSAGIIIAVFDTEGMSDLLQWQIDVTVGKLQELQDYYFTQNLTDIVDRKLEMVTGKNKDGSPKVMKIVAASKEDQIQARGRITENVLKIIPMIDIIKQYKAITARGGVEIKESMQRFIERGGNEKIDRED